MTIPVTVTFAHAGTTTVQAKVQPHRESDDMFTEPACTRK